MYYMLKPLIPRALQIGLRRYIAVRKLKSVSHIWPIDPAAGKSPEGWTGWPENKRFALVLSHDVDTRRGRDRCDLLMQLEEQLGFRSAFNFVPEGYHVPSELIQRLVGKGFDVGVHGLVHDSRLFSSRKAFEQRAPRINRYLREWGAVGFHSPATLRNLDWIGELDVEYDGSTFDTDPFEPQPDGVRTIFPFLVKRNGGRPLRAADRTPQTADRRMPQNPEPSTRNLEPCPQQQEPSIQHSIDSSNPINCMDSTDSQRFYVELPYTLPQDHCVFVIFEMKDIGIWKEKLDWVAAKGGMALLNSHPDYMNFEKRKCRFEEYDVSMYRAFLQYAKSTYEGQYWHALPREMAKFWKRAMVRESQCGETGEVFVGPAERQQEEREQ
jgi:hypothetical protein